MTRVVTTTTSMEAAPRVVRAHVVATASFISAIYRVLIVVPVISMRTVMMAIASMAMDALIIVNSRATSAPTWARVSRVS